MSRPVRGAGWSGRVRIQASQATVSVSLAPAGASTGGILSVRRDGVWPRGAKPRRTPTDQAPQASERRTGARHESPGWRRETPVPAASATPDTRARHLTVSNAIVARMAAGGLAVTACVTRLSIAWLNSMAAILLGNLLIMSLDCKH